jgi:LCP family protein required for cell wall assembly
MQDDETDGRKPYRTYRAKGARRTPLDDELAGARPERRAASRQAPPRETPPRDNGRGYAPPEREYRRYAAGGAGGGEDFYEDRGVYGRDDAADARRAPTAKAAAPRRRRRFRWWHAVVALLILLIVAAVVATVLAWPGYKQFDHAVTLANNRFYKKQHVRLTPDGGWIVRNGTTVLLLGVDSKAGEPARSDTIMLMRFDPAHHTINQLSIPRDTRVELPGRGYNKINEAIFWGGPALAVKTIEKFTGIPINHVMVVNFQGFPRLVNAVGGVDLNVPKTISTTVGGRGRIVTFKKGMHHFDGKYAMAYVRIRKADDDFHRAARQQQFVQALQKKLMRPSNVTKLPLIGKRFMSGVATDLTTNQILELAYLKWRAHGGSHQVMVGEPALIGGVDYVLPPPDAQKQRMIHRFLD